MPLPGHKTKIVATIGPASDSVEVLSAMLRAGMNIARLNFSHGDFDSHRRVIESVRSASRTTGIPVAIMADLSGPKIRIGRFDVEPVTLKGGDPFTLTTDDIVGDRTRVSVSFEPLPRVVKPGHILFINDGAVQLQVVEVRGREVTCTVTVGGELTSRKGLNLPDIDLGIGAFTARDRECLEFALAHGVDAVSQSFVERADDIVAVRQAARALGHEPFVIAKIERSRALERLDEILDASDGVMIARGDLGVEVPIERIALVQKDIMRRANRRAKPVITATQMLESMITHRIPTRAEATDVANAILDGTDCVMLSAESATGSYPVEAVAMLAKIAAAIEPGRQHLPVSELYRGVNLVGRLRTEHLAALSVEACFTYATPAVVFAPTSTGASARRMSLLRLPVWTVGVSSEWQTCQNLQFSYGVVAVHEVDEPDSWNDYVRQWVIRQGVPGDLALLTAGPSIRHASANHRVELIELSSLP